MLSYLLIISQQHGFLSKHSSTTNLLDSLQNRTPAIRDKKYVYVIYINFTQAFDIVSHN